MKRVLARLVLGGGKWPRALSFLLAAFVAGWSIRDAFQVPGPDDSGLFGISFPHMDKVLHFGFYGLLAWLCCKVTWPRHDPRLVGLVMVVLFVSGIGVLNEVLQYALERGRDGDVLDAIVNTLGAGTACLLFGWASRVQSLGGKAPSA